MKLKMSATMGAYMGNSKEEVVSGIWE